jgi:hypothetical protein
VTQVLMDYVAAKHEAIVSVLELLTAEHRLSDEHSSVLALTGAECEVDAAAARLAAAADALPHDRRPVGWSEPPAVAGVIHVARTWLVKAALRCLSAQYADESACADAEAEYAEDWLCIAARNLAAEARTRTARRAS